MAPSFEHLVTSGWPELMLITRFEQLGARVEKRGKMSKINLWNFCGNDENFVENRFYFRMILNFCYILTQFQLLKGCFYDFHIFHSVSEIFSEFLYLYIFISFQKYFQNFYIYIYLYLIKWKGISYE
jgi:hypothetical protein